MTEFKKGDRVRILNSIPKLPEEAKGVVCNVIDVFDDGRQIEVDWEHTGGSTVTGKKWITTPDNLILVKRR